MASWNRKKHVELYPQTFHGTEFDYCWDDINGIISVTHFMKRYELSNDAANNLERWSKDQKQKYEKAVRLVKEFDVEPREWGAERPALTDWYNQLSKEYKEKHVRVYDLNNAVHKTVLTELQKRRILADYGRYLPSFGTIANPEENELDVSEKKGLLCITENGTRYTSKNTDAVIESIKSFYQDQLWKNPTKRPTVAAWYKSLGALNGLGVKAEKFNEAIEMDLEINVDNYQYA